MARRKPRSAATYRRRGPVRESYDLVLIVCEGEKTEPEYFTGLKQAYSLSSANIRISHGDGSDPVSVVKYALERGRDFDRVFCVFDRDGHQNYQQALDKIAGSSMGRKGKLEAITSVPCFEIWILLHFGYSTAPFVKAGYKSACDKVVDAIHVHLPAYHKAFGGVFEHLQPRVNDALNHGNQLAQYNQDTGSENPATRVHELVKVLRDLKK